MGTFYNRICEAQLIAFDRLFIGIDIVIIGVGINANSFLGSLIF